MKFLAALLAISLIASPVSAAAWKTNVAAHQRLVKALRYRGVTVNWGLQYCDSKNSGTYNSRTSSIHICTKGDLWSDENFDTLRHEAIHVLQDLRDCNIGNLVLHRLTNNDQLAELLTHTNLDVKQIINAYASRGANAHIIFLELEAWGGASTTSADAIANVLENVSC
jgi:hypothetical protein